MLYLIPAVKSMVIHEGFLGKKAICYEDNEIDERVLAALQQLPYSENGVNLEIRIDGTAGEAYTLCVETQKITICANGSAGAFYAVQTLRQLFTHKKIPCLVIRDEPDFAYRGFYHDVTRGKVPTLETLKNLVDQMAYYKLNSLQLYVEHTFPFEQCRDIQSAFGCLTKAELMELQDYCRDRFVDFIPSLSTFGHMYEILQQPRYQHLRVLKDYVEEPNYWHRRLAHHTINPRLEESFELVKSLIDQYSVCFDSQWFNICCDETFDLHHCADTPEQIPELYTDFVNKIIAYVRGKGKKIMMWADFLWQWNHPEAINRLPEDICFLNWWYDTKPTEENFTYLAENGRNQIVCPGTGAWNRFCEDVDQAEVNICQLVGFAEKYGALGVLNTNWGDYGHPCSMELGMYGMVLGAEKSWSRQTAVDSVFYARVDHHLYGNENSVGYLKRLSQLHSHLNFKWFCDRYMDYRYHTHYADSRGVCDRSDLKKDCKVLIDELKSQTWKNDEYRQEMILATEAVCLMAQMDEKMNGVEGEKMIDTQMWLDAFREKWLQKNKPSELYRIVDVFTYLDTI